MSGHSKWNNIKRKKEKTDGQKAKIFTRMGREIAVAIKEGGGADPASNSKLKDAIAKAKANNVPNDNIERIIKKAAGDSNADSYEALQYEGYGPCGIAVIVETLTDNRNRTAGEMRHYFDKCGGNLGQTGCVSFMFNKKGIIAIEAEGLDEDTVRHRLASLLRRRYVSRGGYEFPILEHDREATRSHAASYRLGVPKLGPEDGSNILNRKERVEWDRRRREEGME